MSEDPPSGNTRNEVPALKGIGWPYRRREVLDLIERARAMSDGFVVLQGDSGGTIYAVARASRVQCAPPDLVQLLLDLDSIIWPDDDPSFTTSIWIDRAPSGEHVEGGMGGGEVTDGVWVHETFEELGIADEIRRVIEGQHWSIDHFFVRVHVVLRHDQSLVERMGRPAPETVSMVKVVRSAEEADREVERLNARGEEDYVYFSSSGYISPGLITVERKRSPRPYE